MRIIVIIVTYNAKYWIERCFSSLQHSSIIPDMFVVDNGSTDGTQEYIQKNYPEAHFIQSEENIGFGRANNIGLQYALENKYKYVYLLNQDAWVMPDTLEKLLDVSKKHPEYGVLSPMQMQANLQTMDSNFHEHAIGRLKNRKEYEIDMSSGTLHDIYETGFVMAAHWLITRKCLMQVGGFSPTFPHYGEDDNYLQRVNYYGFKIGIVPEVEVVHDRGNRHDTLEKALYMTYIHGLCEGSAPFKKKWWLPLYLWYIFKQAIKFRKPINLTYIFRLLNDVSMIKRNRKISMTQQCAFLYSNNMKYDE